MGAEVQGLGPFSADFPGHEQGAGSELGLEAVPIWDVGTTGSGFT